MRQLKEFKVLRSVKQLTDNETATTNQQSATRNDQKENITFDYLILELI